MSRSVEAGSERRTVGALEARLPVWDKIIHIRRSRDLSQRATSSNSHFSVESFYAYSWYLSRNAASKRCSRRYDLSPSPLTKLQMRSTIGTEHLYIKRFTRFKLIEIRSCGGPVVGGIGYSR